MRKVASLAIFFYGVGNSLENRHAGGKSLPAFLVRFQADFIVNCSSLPAREIFD